MPKALAIQINWQFVGGAGIMQVEHTADRFGGAWLKSEPMQGQNLEEGRYVGVSRTSVIAHVYPEMSISSIICSS